MVRPERFELPTFWFVARRSIQLSYERIFTCLHYFLCGHPVALCVSCFGQTVFSWTVSAPTQQKFYHARQQAARIPVWLARREASAGKLLTTRVRIGSAIGYYVEQWGTSSKLN